MPPSPTAPSSMETTSFAVLSLTTRTGGPSGVGTKRPSAPVVPATTWVGWRTPPLASVAKT